jgi:hypothetical protein
MSRQGTAGSGARMKLHAGEIDIDDELANLLSVWFSGSGR